MTKAEPMISVIVPIYNRKEYIGECVSSILNQSYQALEVILVDDCSTDGAYEFCKQEYAGLPNVTLVRQSGNQGAGAARNRGLLLAQGKYIAFVDSDDFIKEDAMKLMVVLAEKQQADVVWSMGRYYQPSGDGQLVAAADCLAEQREMNALPDDLGQRLALFYTDKAWVGAVWNRIYRRSFLRSEDIHFTDLSCNEDTLFNFECLCKAGRYVLTSTLYYVYRLSDTSILRQHKTLDNLDKQVQDTFTFARLAWNIMQQIPYFTQYPDVREQTMAALVRNQLEMPRQWGFYPTPAEYRTIVADTVRETLEKRFGADAWLIQHLYRSWQENCSPETVIAAERKNEMDVIITIPIYKEKLTIAEQISLRQLNKVLGSYPRTFIAPESLSFDYGKLAEDIEIVRFPDHYFRSTAGYSQLMLSEEFYAQFTAYEYVLIYQTDAFVFSDRLHEFCAMGYDYIGAPVSRYNQSWHAIGARVGNGGLSLRRVSAAIRMIQQWGKEQFAKENIYLDLFLRWEDLFWGWCSKQSGLDFHSAPIDTALSFAVQGNVQRVYARMGTGNFEPFGCHGWDKLHADFWRKKVAACGYDVTAIPYFQAMGARRYYLQTYARQRNHIDVMLLWGALKQKNYTQALARLTGWLATYSAGDTSWQGCGEELQYIWRWCRQRQTGHNIEEDLLEQALDEAICRSLLLAGSCQEYLPTMMEGLLPLIRQKQSAAARHLTEVIEAISNHGWEQRAVYAQSSDAAGDHCRLIAISMVKNEMDIIESFVRHTLSFADEMIICDHQSTDKTRQILQSLQQEGLPITIETEYRAEYAQAEATTALMYQAVHQHQADFVLPLDADEFIVPMEQGKSIRSVFRQLSKDQVYALRWRRAAPFKAVEKDTAFILSRPLLIESNFDAGQKVVVGADLLRTQQLCLTQGNHYLYQWNQNESREILPNQNLTALYIAHFFWRSREQFATKIAVGWPNIIAKYSLAAASGGSYRPYHDRLQHGEMIQAAELMNQTVLKDLRPFILPQTLLYSQQVTPNPMANLMAASVLLAEQVAEQDVIANKVIVTTVIVYHGDKETFHELLQQAAKQTYPWQQVILPVMEALSVEDRQFMETACEATLTGKVWAWQLVKATAEVNVFDSMEAAAKGRYVYWLLPEADPVPILLTRMVTGMMKQDLPMGIMITGIMDDYPSESPFICIGTSENTQVFRRDEFWHRLLELGKYPAGGIASALISRSVMKACSWLRDAVLLPEVQLLSFMAWRQLLLADGEACISVLRDTYIQLPAAEQPLTALVMHQLEWLELLKAEQDDWDETDWKRAIQQFRCNGEKLLTKAIELQVDTETMLWQQYQQELIRVE